MSVTCKSPETVLNIILPKEKKRRKKIKWKKHFNMLEYTLSTANIFKILEISFIKKSHRVVDMDPWYMSINFVIFSDVRQHLKFIFSYRLWTIRIFLSANKL